MSDLRDCSVTVSLFLFGKVHDEHWKTPEGSVVGILNASVLPQREKVGINKQCPCKFIFLI